MSKAISRVTESVYIHLSSFFFFNPFYRKQKNKGTSAKLVKKKIKIMAVLG